LLTIATNNSVPTLMLNYSDGLPQILE